MELKLNIKSVQIIETSSIDKITFFSEDIKTGLWPYTGPLALEIQCAHGTALDYLNENFPEIIEVEYLNMTHPKWIHKRKLDNIWILNLKEAKI